MRIAVPLAALAVAALPALPASADYPPTDCSAYLILATTSQSSGCNTIGASPLVSGADHRVMTVYVQTGQVSATLGCGGDGYHSYPEEKTIVVTAPWSGSATVDRTSYCWMSLTATVDGTTAYASNDSAAYLK